MGRIAALFGLILFVGNPVPASADDPEPLHGLHKAATALAGGGANDVETRGAETGRTARPSMSQEPADNGPPRAWSCGTSGPIAAGADSEDIRTEVSALIEAQSSLYLATLGNDGKPEASYAPFVCDEDGNFYIFVSKLTKHTRNLSARGQLGVLVIEPEADAREAFARRRLIYECVAETVPRESAEWDKHLAAFEERFGEIIETLRGMPDFVLFRLVPQRGTFVRGFGQAYTIDAEAIEHISPDRLKDTLD